MGKDIIFKITTIGLLSFALTGCSYFLYSDKLAPVYSGTNSSNRQAPPARLPATSIENPNTAISNGYHSYSNPVRPRIATPAPATPTSQFNGTVNRPPAAGSDHYQAPEVFNPAMQTPNPSVNQIATTANNNAKSAVDATKQNAIKGRQTVTSSNTPPTVTDKNIATMVPAKAVKPAMRQTPTHALLKQAKTAVEDGNYDKAADALERAHRIDPNNAKILYDIAQIRYAQAQYAQAASFAANAANKSASPSLSKKIWTLLANARKALGDTTGAATALQKAATF